MEAPTPPGLDWCGVGVAGSGECARAGAAAGGGRMGARLLPAVQECAARLPQGDLEGRQLEGRGKALRCSIVLRLTELFTLFCIAQGAIAYGKSHHVYTNVSERCAGLVPGRSY